MSPTESWIRDEFPAANNDLVEMTEDYEVWKKRAETASAPVEVSVLSKREDGTQSCTYQFESEEAWRKTRTRFLKELSNSLAGDDANSTF